MDAIVDYPFSSNPSDVDGKEDASSTPEPSWTDPHCPRLSDAIYFCSDIVCISSHESTDLPPPK